MLTVSSLFIYCVVVLATLVVNKDEYIIGS